MSQKSWSTRAPGRTSARVAPLCSDHAEAAGWTFDHRDRAHGLALVGDRVATDGCRIQDGVRVDELRDRPFPCGDTSFVLSEFRLDDLARPRARSALPNPNPCGPAESLAGSELLHAPRTTSPNTVDVQMTRMLF